jgi:Ca-activated chloride channel family protein
VKAEGIPWQRVLSLAALVLVALGVAAGAEPSSERSRRAPVDDATIERLLALHHTESSSVRLVLLPASVTDRKGRAVPGLEKSDFRLFEDSRPQPIQYFSSEAREPVAIAFLLDISGSMRQFDKLGHAKEAIRFFVDQLRSGDRFALICFADRQVAWITEFTDDRDWFLRRLAVQEAYGQTALNDAVAAAPGLVSDHIKGRKAIILITDGVDNFSQLGIADAVDIARRVSVPIYTIGFTSVSEELLPKDERGVDLSVLRYVSAETGGQLFPVQDPEELKEAVLVVDQELRHQYLIGYQPAWEQPDGRFHTLRLEAGKTKLRVRTRTGYYAE